MERTYSNARRVMWSGFAGRSAGRDRRTEVQTFYIFQLANRSRLIVESILKTVIEGR
jgi:hypothetical protein